LKRNKYRTPLRLPVEKGFLRGLRASAFGRQDVVFVGTKRLRTCFGGTELKLFRRFQT
jgi:hypothetical protein